MREESISIGTNLDEEFYQPDADSMELAERIDAIALQNTADQEATVAYISKEQQRIFHEIIEAGQTIDEFAVTSLLREMQRERMVEIFGDTNVVVSSLQDGIAGFYDGKRIVVDVNCIEKSVIKHEMQHKKDGLPENLDDDLFAKTGIAIIDEQMKSIGSMRDILEERAMDAANEIPAAYRNTHWTTVKDMEARGRNAGIDMENANADLIETHDIVFYNKLLLKIAIYEILHESTNHFADILVKTNTDDTRDIIERPLPQLV